MTTTPKLSAITKMVRLVTIEHAGQTRKSNGLPYITHLAEVAGYVSMAGADIETILMAWGHDLIEDCGVGPGTLTAKFGQIVSNGIVYLSSNLDPGSNRQERHASSLKRLKAGDARVHDVKCADITSNLSALHMLPGDTPWRGMYLQEKFEQLDVLRLANTDLWDYAYATARKAEELCRV